MSPRRAPRGREPASRISVLGGAAGLSGLLLLFACAGAGRSAPAMGAVEPDCSFRSATTCWTVAARFPPRRPAGDPPSPGDGFDRTPAAIAAGAPDSGARAPLETGEEPGWAAQPKN